jgi:hypothetical protein
MNAKRVSAGALAKEDELRRLRTVIRLRIIGVESQKRKGSSLRKILIGIPRHEIKSNFEGVPPNVFSSDFVLKIRGDFLN